MSRKGECLDNAVAESIFGTLKTELTDHEDYRTKAQARQSLFEYIEVFYNRQRRHSFLDYMTPRDRKKGTDLFLSDGGPGRKGDRPVVVFGG